jgi:hypothetical protein
MNSFFKSGFSTTARPRYSIIAFLAFFVPIKKAMYICPDVKLWGNDVDTQHQEQSYDIDILIIPAQVYFYRCRLCVYVGVCVS